MSELHAVNIVTLACMFKWYLVFLLRSEEYSERKVNNYTTLITAVVAATLISTAGSFQYSRARIIRGRSLELRWVDLFLGGHSPEGVECTAMLDTWPTSHTV